MVEFLPSCQVDNGDHLHLSDIFVSSLEWNYLRVRFFDSNDIIAPTVKRLNQIMHEISVMYQNYGDTLICRAKLWKDTYFLRRERLRLNKFLRKSILQMLQQKVGKKYAMTFAIQNMESGEFSHASHFEVDKLLLEANMRQRIKVFVYSGQDLTSTPRASVLVPVSV